MGELTMTYEVRRQTTVMTVTGVVDDDRSTDLDDGLEVARAIRRRGPIVVDLGWRRSPHRRCCH